MTKRICSELIVTRTGTVVGTDDCPDYEERQGACVWRRVSGSTKDDDCPHFKRLTGDTITCQHGFEEEEYD